MKIKIKCCGSWLKDYKDQLEKYNPVDAFIEYYFDDHTEQYPAYLIDIPSLAIISKIAEEVHKDIIYRRGVKKGDEGYQEPFLLIYDDYIE